MPYVGLQDDDKIAVFALDTESGALTKRADVAEAGGPSVAAISPERSTLYVGYREQPSIASYRIDPASGGLALSGNRSPSGCTDLLAPDRTGRYMLCAYYQGGYVAVDAIAADGTVGPLVADSSIPRPARMRSWRSVQPLRLCAAHRPHPGQRVGAAEEQSRPQRDPAVPLRRSDRSAEPEYAASR